MPKATTPAVPAVRSGRSRAGRLVTLTRTRGTYVGAQPYYILTYEGRTNRTLYPVTRERAEALFEVYGRDITDPQAVKDALAAISSAAEAS